MPLPTPKDDETRQEFVDRCMENPQAIDEFPTEGQRVAVCINRWDTNNSQVENKMTKNKYFNVNASASGYNVRTANFEGRRHIVAPVTLMVEGVHAGSGGPVFYSAHELSRFHDAWNGIPLPIDHPTDENGTPIHANSPDVIESASVGRLFNVHFDNTKRALMGEIWVDEDKARGINPCLLSRLNRGEPIEVSTGLWTDGDGTPGAWNGESYQESVRNFRPDHLAILPDSIGACSLEDGCGVRANKECKRLTVNQEDRTDMDKPFLQKIREKFFGETNLIDNASMEEIGRQLMPMVDALDRDVINGRIIHYIKATFPEDKKLVLSQEGPEGTKLFEVDFETDSDGLPMSLGDEFREVKMKVDFTPINNASQEEKEEPEMSEDVKTNGCGCDCKKEPPKENEMETKTPDPVSNQEDTPKTFDEHLADLPEDVRGTIQNALSVANAAKEAEKAEKAKLIESIKANEDNKFTDNALDSMDTPTLEALSHMVCNSTKKDEPPKVDEPTPLKQNAWYGQAGGAPSVNTKENEPAPLQMPKL